MVLTISRQAMTGKNAHPATLSTLVDYREYNYLCATTECDGQLPLDEGDSQGATEYDGDGDLIMDSLPYDYVPEDSSANNGPWPKKRADCEWAALALKDATDDDFAPAHPISNPTGASKRSDVSVKKPHLKKHNQKPARDLAREQEQTPDQAPTSSRIVPLGWQRALRNIVSSNVNQDGASNAPPSQSLAKPKVVYNRIGAGLAVPPSKKQRQWNKGPKSRQAPHGQSKQLDPRQRITYDENLYVAPTV